MGRAVAGDTLILRYYLLDREDERRGQRSSHSRVYPYKIPIQSPVCPDDEAPAASRPPMQQQPDSQTGPRCWNCQRVYGT